MENTMDSGHYFSHFSGLYGNQASDRKINNRFRNGVNGAIMAVNVIFCWKVPLSVSITLFDGKWEPICG